jgi:hypothetical protein
MNTIAISEVLLPLAIAVDPAVACIVTVGAIGVRTANIELPKFDAKVVELVKRFTGTKT